MREFRLLEHIFRANTRLGSGVSIPPGDDMGGITLAGNLVLAGVDQLVDGRHFQLQTTPLNLVGRKAITRCLSDAAAMAARPVAALVAATLPPDFGEERANELFDSMRQTCETYSTPLIGGDIAMHSSSKFPLTISTTILAASTERGAVERRGAKPGDGVYVTGRLGGSLRPDGLGRHLTFEPRIVEALELHKALGDRLHAMIDISDGLGRDASHVASMSQVQIVIDASRIPCSENCTWKQALGDGEDYELLFVAEGPVAPHLGKVQVTRIGEVVAMSSNDEPLVRVKHDGSYVDAAEFGWEHHSDR